MLTCREAKGENEMNKKDIAKIRQVDTIFEPKITQYERSKKYTAGLDL